MKSETKKLALAALMTASLAASPLAAQAAEGMSAPAKTELTKELHAMIGDTGTSVPGLGVVVYKDGKKVYSHFDGRRHIDNKNPKNDLKVTADTRFRVASVSKQFTSFTIMQLVDQGKVNLDGDISQYLGFKLRNPNYPDKPITVRMLLSHTSSLRDGTSYSIPPEYSIKEFFSPAGKFWDQGHHFAEAGQAPGQYFKYCNLNYGLLGTIIEAVTGQRFDKYQKNHILKQLDIKADYKVGGLAPEEFKMLGAIYQKNLDGKWNEKGPWIAQMDEYNGKQPANDMVMVQNPDVRASDWWYSLKNYRPGTNATMFSPQGGLRISYNELEHCLQLLMNRGTYKGKQIIKPELIDAMLTPQWQYNPAHPNGSTYGGTILSYGLGEYQIIGNSTSRVCKDHEINLVGHTGEAYGLLSGVFFKPGTKDGFVYMMNGEAVAEDDDPRSAGNFSGNYVWEENVMNAICKNAFFFGKDK